jgi:hypothetical protein
MFFLLRWAAVILAVTGLSFALRWPRRLPYRNTALLGGCSALAIAGSPLLFGYGSTPMVAGTILGLGLAIASCWTVVQAGGRSDESDGSDGRVAG